MPLLPSVYTVTTHDDGSVTVVDRANGLEVLTAPTAYAPLVLGWMRLAAYAHAQLRGDERELHRVLTGGLIDNLEGSSSA